MAKKKVDPPVAATVPAKPAPPATPELEAHALAKLFPLLDGEELEEFKKCLAQGDIEDPIVLHEGKILDGQNRYSARKALGLPILTRQWQGEGGTPLQFVIAKNLRRRQLNSGQRAALATALLPLLKAEAKERQRAHAGTAPGKAKGTKGHAAAGEAAGQAVVQAAKLVGSNSHYVHDAQVLETKRPDLLDKVRQGDISLPAAVKEVRKKDRAARSSPAQSPGVAKVDVRAFARQVGDFFELVCQLTDKDHATKVTKQVGKLAADRRNELAEQVERLVEALGTLLALLEPPAQAA